ncbi:hypothetical protein V5O48_010802 [Marasmius crinis-equi]|uniref:Cation-transporting ATPase n=1 Tax=Marasmius crinis-equi TaxID=585013 RepID=A0ABR3F7T1_9AGAR
MSKTLSLQRPRSVPPADSEEEYEELVRELEPDPRYATPGPDDAPEEIQERISDVVDRLMQLDEQWTTFFAWKNQHHVPGRLKVYEFIKKMADRYVGRRVPFRSARHHRFKMHHILRALLLNNDPKLGDDCLETLHLLSLYGPEGTRLQDPRIVKEMDNKEQPKHGAKPIKRFLRLLREIDREWQARSNSTRPEAEEPGHQAAGSVNEPLESGTGSSSEVIEMTPVAGSSRPDPTRVHDYTEGAAPIDIEAAVSNNRRSRRDSQYSAYDDVGEGSIFSGPGHSAIPSSVTRMPNVEPGRRSSDGWSRNRRRSIDSSRRSLDRRLSQDSEASQTSRRTEEDEDEDGLSESYGTRRIRHRSPSPDISRSGVLGNIASFFGKSSTTEPPDGRRSAMSRRSSGSFSRHSRRSSRSRSEAGSEYGAESDNEQERWGYSSGEEGSDDGVSVMSRDHRDDISITASMQYDSEPPSPSLAHNLPLLNSDPIFGGESRIDIEIPFSELDPPPPGPPARQTLYMEDEDTSIRMIGYEAIVWREHAWRICCIVTCGILGLLGHWFPRLWLRWVARETSFKKIRRGFVVVETLHTDVALFPVKILDYPYPIHTALPPVASDGLSTPTSNASDDTYDVESKILRKLLVVDYRYTRFILDPRTGLFSVLRLVIRLCTVSSADFATLLHLTESGATQRARLPRLSARAW